MPLAFHSVALSNKQSRVTSVCFQIPQPSSISNLKWQSSGGGNITRLSRFLHQIQLRHALAWMKDHVVFGPAKERLRSLLITNVVVRIEGGPTISFSTSGSSNGERIPRPKSQNVKQNRWTAAEIFKSLYAIHHHDCPQGAPRLWGSMVGSRSAWLSLCTLGHGIPHYKVPSGIVRTKQDRKAKFSRVVICRPIIWLSLCHT